MIAGVLSSVVKGIGETQDVEGVEKKDGAAETKKALEKFRVDLLAGDRRVGGQKGCAKFGGFRLVEKVDGVEKNNGDVVEVEANMEIFERAPTECVVRLGESEGVRQWVAVDETTGGARWLER